MFTVQIGFQDPRDYDNIIWANVETFEDKASARAEYDSLISGVYHVRILEETVVAFHIGRGW